MSGYSATVAAMSGSGAVIDSNPMGGASLTFGNSTSSTFSGTLFSASPLSNLTKNGTGTFVLTGTNYAASTAINQGTFQIGNGTANGFTSSSGAYAIANVARLYFNQGATPITTLPWSGISGAGLLELNDSAGSGNGGAVLYSNLSLPVTSTGTLQVDHRGLVTTTPSGLGGMSTVIINSGAQFFAYDGTANGTSYTYTQSFTISGVGSGYTQVGSSLFSYANGALRVNGMNANFTGNIAVSGSSGLMVDSTTGSVLKVSGIISGGTSSSLTFSDPNYPNSLIILAAANSFSGAMTVSTAQAGNKVQLSNSAAAQNSTWSGPVQFDTVGAGTNTFLFGALSGSSPIALSNASSNAITLIVGNNSATTTDSGPLTGPGSLTKIGTGQLTLTGSNTYVGGTTISGGTLKIGSGSSGVLNPSGTISDNGVLIFARNNAMIQGIDFSSAPITGTGSLVQLTANGNLVLNAANSYSGTTGVTAGTLTVNGSLVPSSTVTVAAAGTLGGSGSVNGPTIINSGGGVLGGSGSAGSLTLASLTFGGSGNLFGGLGASTTSPPPIIVSGALTTAGSTINVNITGIRPTVVGSYPFLDYGSLNGSTSSFQLANAPRATSLVSTGNTLSVNFSSMAYPIWTGTGSIGTTFSGNSNWRLSDGSGPTDYKNLDSIVFDDTAPGSTTVGISQNGITPFSTTFNNSTLTYALTGSRGIGGLGSLTKNGTGLLTLANSNSYSGGTFINGGTLTLGSFNALLSGGLVSLGSGTSSGTFNLNGFSPTVGTLAVGAGATASSQLITASSGSSTLTFSNTNGIASSFGGTITDTAPSGGTLGLTVSSGLLDLSAGNLAYHGPTNISGGRLNVSVLLNSSSVTMTGGVLGIVGANTNLAMPITNNGAIIYSGGSGTLSGQVIPGTGIINGALTVVSGGLSLTGTASFPGFVTVGGGGTLAVPSGGSLTHIPLSLIPLSVGDINGSGIGTLVVSGGTISDQGHIDVLSFSNSASKLIMSGGLVDEVWFDQAPGTGITIAGYCSVSGGLFSASGLQGAGINAIGIGGSSAGTMEVSGGTVTSTGNINVGFNNLGGLLNQSGGLVTCAVSMNLGYQGTAAGAGGGTANLSGGTLDLSTGNGILYNGYGQSSTVNISGSATVIVPTFNMGYGSLGYSNSSIVNTLNLNGGTLHTNAIVNSLNGLDTNTVNFNGGLLVGMMGSTDILSGMTNAFVLAGGARIDDGGNAITISQNLQSGASNDGGLTKSGAGTLIVAGSNTFNGPTKVQEGILQVGNASALGVGGLIANAGTLDLNGYSVTVASLSGAAGAVTDYGFTGGTTTLTVSQTGGTSFGGQIVDGQNDLVALKLSGGTLTLTGSNTYTGGTTVNNGTLIVKDVQGLADGSSLTVGNPLAFPPMPAAAVPSAAAASAVAPVPEPGTLALLAAGAAAALWYGRRRRIAL
jgi:autotransporter-associated beta strand protein